ncbi:hypothetical protein ACFCVU_25200 [Peribacillus butanolivorans]|uniref:hypothetical protein n=1 Tax=Peribacillus butanolivorans TaxID=421767 RepID=UPI0035D64D97
MSHAFINSYVFYDAVEMMAVLKTSAAIVLETKQRQLLNVNTGKSVSSQPLLI